MKQLHTNDARRLAFAIKVLASVVASKRGRNRVKVLRAIPALQRIRRAIA